MSTSMKSVLTSFNDDNSPYWRWTENYIDQDHTMVSYTPGTGGEWFCGFLATHEELAKMNTAMQPQRVNNQNRWRIKNSCVGRMADRYRDDYYNQKDAYAYDGSEEWFRVAVGNAIEGCKKNDLRSELRDHLTVQTITRSHEAWNECHMWSQQFRSFKVITTLNKRGDDTWDQFVSNIAKKIWLHEFKTHEEYISEFENKFQSKRKNHPYVDEYEALDLLDHLGAPYTWYKLTYTLICAAMKYDHDLSHRAMLDKWNSEIADWKLKNYQVPLPVPELKIDLLHMLRERDYTDGYQSICEHMQIKPHPLHIFEKMVDHYFAEDEQNRIVEKDIMDIISGVAEHARTFTPRQSKALL